MAIKKKSNIFILREFCKRTHCTSIGTLALLLFITEKSQCIHLKQAVYHDTSSNWLQLKIYILNNTKFTYQNCCHSISFAAHCCSHSTLGGCDPCRWKSYTGNSASLSWWPGIWPTYTRDHLVGCRHTRSILSSAHCNFRGRREQRAWHFLPRFLWLQNSKLRWAAVYGDSLFQMSQNGEWERGKNLF